MFGKNGHHVIVTGLCGDVSKTHICIFKPRLINVTTWAREKKITYQHFQLLLVLFWNRETAPSGTEVNTHLIYLQYNLSFCTCLCKFSICFQEIIFVLILFENVCGLALYSYTYFLSTEFAFRIVNAPMALDLAFGIVCELLQRWGEIHAGVPVLLEWLLGDSDLQRDGETSALVILTSSCYSMFKAL